MGSSFWDVHAAHGGFTVKPRPSQYKLPEVSVPESLGRHRQGVVELSQRPQAASLPPRESTRGQLPILPGRAPGGPSAAYRPATRRVRASRPFMRMSQQQSVVLPVLVHGAGKRRLPDEALPHH